jgi:nitrogen fixation protein FixH
MSLPWLLLGASIAGGVAMARVAMDDPGFALEPEYYTRATHFDQEVARRTASARLGWSARIVALGAPNAVDRIELALVDREGQPVTGARMKVVAFANGHAAQRFDLELDEPAPGRFQGRVPVPRLGLWELRVSARRGDADFVTRLRGEWPTQRGD